MRVLLIEDDDDIALLFTLALEDAGHEVVTARTGADGVAMAATAGSDVIVLDRMLPDLDGLEVLRRLAGDGEVPAIPVVMSSARVGAADQLAALAAGASAYVVKPSHAEVIARVVEDVARLDLAGRAELRRRTMAALGDHEVAAAPPPPAPASVTPPARREEASEDTFLRTASHALRTPLTSVIGFAGLLVDQYGDRLPPDALDVAVRIRSNADRLGRLFDDLVALERLDRGLLHAERRPVPVAEAIAQAIEKVTFGERTVVVDVDPPALEADLDPTQVSRLLHHLLVNAANHTPPGATVEVRAARSADGLLLVVDDDGPGVPADLRIEVFEPFRRCVESGAIPGAGVGLSLVERFAALHGGRAWVEGRDGGGASFRVILPD